MQRKLPYIPVHTLSGRNLGRSGVLSWDDGMPEVVEFITSVAAVGTKVEGYVQLSEVVVN